MMPDAESEKLENLLLDDGLIRTKKEQLLVKNAREEATNSVDQLPIALLIARKFIRNYMMNPALIRAETIVADKSEPDSYDPLEFAAPISCTMSTYDDSVVPRLLNTKDIIFDEQNQRGGFNGVGMRIAYGGRGYFLKNNISRANIIAASDLQPNITPPRNNALQEVFYINLFHKSKKLTNNTPKSCCFVLPSNVQIIADILKAPHFVRPKKIDVFEEIETDRVIIWMDQLPTENTFSNLPLADKFRHYRNTILEFHRFAASEGISMRDDKPDCYCIDSEGILKRFDFGGCANFNHKKQGLSRDMTYNILDNIYRGIYLTRNSNSPGLGELGEFDFHKATLDADTKLISNPKGLLFWIASIKLNARAGDPNEVIDVVDGVLSKLEAAHAYTKQERELIYNKFSKTKIAKENFDDLIALSETEESESRLRELIDTHKDDINALIVESVSLQEKHKVVPVGRAISFDNMFEDDIDWEGLVDLWERTVGSSLDETSRRSASRAIGLLRRSSDCKSVPELQLKNWGDIINNLPPHAQASDISVVRQIFDKLKQLPPQVE